MYSAMKNRRVHQIKSAHIVASIDNLVLEILFRLPIKFLIRFKLVSKRWFSIISSPGFCRRRSFKPNSAVGHFFEDLYHCRYENISYIPYQLKNRPPLNFNFTGDAARTQVVDSCNGLFLCSTYGLRRLSSDPKKKTFFVYNPTTNKFSRILEYDDKEYGINGNPALAFDPVRSPHYFAICLLYSRSAQAKLSHLMIQFYSSEIKGWRNKGNIIVESHVNLSNSVYWNGSIHWIGYKDDGMYLRFNIDRQKFEGKPDPPVRDGTSFGKFPYAPYLGQSCDHLHYIEGTSRIIFDVYELKMDYSEWFVKYQVDLSSVAHVYPLPYDDVDVQYGYFISSLVRSPEGENSFLVLQIGREVIKYNLVDRTFQRIYRLNDPVSYINIKVFQYIETLWPVG